MSPLPGPGPMPSTARLVLLPTAATAVGMAAGWLAGSAVLGAREEVRDGPVTTIGEGFGDAILGALAGGGVGLVVLAVGLALAAGRLLPLGRRAGAVWLSLLAVCVGPFVVGALAQALLPQVPAVAPVGGLVALGLPAAVFWLRARSVYRPGPPPGWPLPPA